MSSCSMKARLKFPLAPVGMCLLKGKDHSLGVAILIKTRNLEQYAELHRTRKYGDTGVRKRKIIEPWIKIERPVTVLDYGAGQSQLVNRIKCASIAVRDRYDPAIPDISKIPRSNYDLVICTDVFEHLDEDEAPKILRDIARITRKVIFCIDTRVASTILPNGENAHATVKSPDWWLATVAQHFPDSEIVKIQGSSAYIKTWRSSAWEKGVAWFLRKIQKTFHGEPG